MRKLYLFLILVFGVLSASAQDGGIALSPGRFELEMDPGTDTTVLINVDYRAGAGADPTKAARIVASLNDWTITKGAQVEYFPANTRPDSASSWVTYTPAEAAVMPGTVHQIRVTISVPPNATPGDHLTSIIIEQRPENLHATGNTKQVVVKYRMASVFYIKVKGLTHKGDMNELLAESTPEGVTVKPTLKNDGNSMVRPLGSAKVIDADGKVAAEIPDFEMMPVLAGSEIDQRFEIPAALRAGNYTVKCRVDFQDGRPPIEGVTDLVVKTTQIATAGEPKKKP